MTKNEEKPTKTEKVEKAEKADKKKEIKAPVKKVALAKEKVKQDDDKLFVADREIVVPGAILATGMSYLPSQGTYRQGEHIRCGLLGMTKIEGTVLKIIPISGVYIPKSGDVIIAQVIDVLMSGWKLGINSAYPAVLPLKDATSSFIEKGDDLTKYYALGDYMVGRITNVTSQRLIDVSMKGPSLRKISGGRIIKVNASKVPRLIGKQGSMVSLIKESTDCKLVVGQNGVVWLEGEPERENITVEAIRRIEKEAHLPGMTDRIKKFLEEKLGIKIDMEKIMEKAQAEFQERRQFDRDRPQRHGGGGHGGGFRGGQRRGPPRHGGGHSGGHGGGHSGGRPRFRQPSPGFRRRT